MTTGDSRGKFCVSCGGEVEFHLGCINNVHFFCEDCLPDQDLEAESYGIEPVCYLCEAKNKLPYQPQTEEHRRLDEEFHKEFFDDKKQSEAKRNEGVPRAGGVDSASPPSVDRQSS